MDLLELGGPPETRDPLLVSAITIPHQSCEIIAIFFQGPPGAIGLNGQPGDDGEAVSFVVIRLTSDLEEFRYSVQTVLLLCRVLLVSLVTLVVLATLEREYADSYFLFVSVT